MTVQVWTAEQLEDALVEQWKRDLDSVETSQYWADSIRNLRKKAHARGDGVAVYVNSDLSHPEVGQWQVASYGGDEAQLETREDWDEGDLTASPDHFVIGQDTLRRTLPDIGGRINWRYQLHAVVPAPCEEPGCVYSAGHDTSVFPHREALTFLHTNPQRDYFIVAVGADERCLGKVWVSYAPGDKKWHALPDATTSALSAVFDSKEEAGEALRAFNDRERDSNPYLVNLTIRVSGGLAQADAEKLVEALVENGLGLYSESGGEIGFAVGDTTGTDAFDKGITLDLIETSSEEVA